MGTPQWLEAIFARPFEVGVDLDLDHNLDPTLSGHRHVLIENHVGIRTGIAVGDGVVGRRVDHRNWLASALTRGTLGTASTRHKAVA